MTTLNVTRLAGMAVRVHAANAKWWTNLDTGERIERNFGELCMLKVSELAEALEGDRKNLQDDKLPHRLMIEVELADALIRTLDTIGGLQMKIFPVQRPVFDPVANVGESLLRIVGAYVRAYDHHFMRSGPDHVAQELSNAIAAIEDLADALGLDLYGAYEEKMAYNAQREDHKIEARKLTGGKKY